MELDFDKAGGIIPAVAQDADTGEILMLAYVNEEAWKETLATGFAVYYSRSRKRLWKKGETSGNVQRIRRILVDCDRDSVVFVVDQSGPACHTGHRSCFFTEYKDNRDVEIAPVVVKPEEMYGK
ncbi:MAG: phosphoribosyl-AMP cyclohydrolase [Victivallaceae bacterium]|nr:phosphoribosyl-AMP cyclohydrolase [Victivallaceae bacterium]